MSDEVIPIEPHIRLMTNTDYSLFELYVNYEYISGYASAREAWDAAFERVFPPDRIQKLVDDTVAGIDGIWLQGEHGASLDAIETAFDIITGNLDLHRRLLRFEREKGAEQ